MRGIISMLHDVEEKIMADQIKFHFLNVGDGDCTIVEFPSGRLGMVDVCTKNEGTNVVQYMKSHLPDKNVIFRFILTHPHQDHLHGLKELTDAGFSIMNFWHTKHDFEPDKKTADWEEYEPHWKKYDEIRKSDSIKTFRQGQQPNFLNEDGITILSPCDHLDEQASELKNDANSIHRNNYAIKIQYGTFSAILSGDSDIPCWNHLKDDDKKLTELSCDVWKVPHHENRSLL